jgi:peptidoglycan/xylan/chitin deacetylase (PgdA/CDA1 family)
LENPELARLLVAEGHHVASHTYSHPVNFCFLSPRRLKYELREGREAIVQTCNITPNYFRSPVGLRHPLLRRYLLETGLEYISWGVRGYDSRIQNPEVLARRITKNVVPGSIILLHDKACKATDCMLEALPGIIDDLKRKGFEFVLV